jgi:signal transduction histidine kinase/CheY-like chemotaxis protein
MNSNNWKKALKANYVQICFVCLAFALMVAIGGYSVGRVINEKSYSTVNNALNETEKTIQAYLREPKIAFDNISTAVQDMLDRGASQKAIVQYLTQTTNVLKSDENTVKGFSALYGYLRGEFLSGHELNFGSDYIPQQRPWYQQAIRSKTLVYTSPYVDAKSGNMIISLARELYGAKGERYGVLAINVDIAWLMDYSKELVFTDGGYGIIVDQHLYTIAHPKEEYVDMPLRDLGKDYEKIANMLRDGKDISAEFIRDFDKTRSIVFFKGLYNGWFVGVVLPFKSYFSDLFFALFWLAGLGIVLALILSYILLRLSIAKILSEEANKSKSSFLARMSHEIRTPMNAIIGLSELALREEISPRAQEHVLTIKQAGKNLLSIINDILDFSKIESGKLEIIPADYMFSSLANEVINIIRMRLVDTHIRFVVNMDSNIPHILFGDETRIRQILLNVLGNAVKYTKEGFISLTVNSKKTDSETLVLVIDVEDSGVGIKREDLGKLFSEFTQFDLARNRGIEGTGLGLSIARSLLKSMGGDVSVTSKYGEGSKFTITLPQKIHSDKKMVHIENASEKSILIYEPREIYAKSLLWTMKNFGLKHAFVSDNAEFCQKIKDGKYSFIFIAAPLYEKVEQKISESEAKAVLLTEFGKAIANKNLSMLTMPAHCISIASILNGASDDFHYHEHGEETARFIAPEAQVLVVDDINTNLSVAEGLMQPYRMQIDTSLSGEHAIEKVKTTKYDIIFMDHMMPEMDGIEATACIRKLHGEYYQTVPIIALTANAISGAKDMFLKNGFNDFLSKPIDMVKLNTILSKWIPKEKQSKLTDEPVGAALSGPEGNDILISGIDVKKGVAMLGGNVKSYLQTLAIFQKDGWKKTEEIKKCLEGNNLPLYATYVHALKSASANIGAMVLSEAAKELEAAAKLPDINFVKNNSPKFLTELETLLQNISQAIETDIKTDDGSIDTALLKTKLTELKTALDSLDLAAINELTEFLQDFASAPEVGGNVEKILQNVLKGEYDEAVGMIYSFV